MKKVAFVLVLLLVVPTLLSACGAESSESSRDYMDAVLDGKVEDAQKYACDDFKDATAELIASLPHVGENNAVRNIDLKFDVGKGNDQEKITVTGSYDIVVLNATGKVVADSNEEYELASSVRDKRDIDSDEDDGETVDTRITLKMEKDGDDWCVASLEGGYWDPTFTEEAEVAEDEDSAAEEEQDGAADEEGEADSD